MSQSDDLTVHDVKVSERSVISPGGAITRQVSLVFYVGAHGPFMRTFTPEEYSAQKARAEIDGVVQGLRVLAGGS